jgi:hypothetical protein
MIRQCGEARNNADTLDRHKLAIDPIIRLIPKGSRATLQAITTKINDMAGTNETFKSDIPKRALSHLWSKKRNVRSAASVLNIQSMEALLAIYGQQQEYEKATGISGEVPYGSSLKQSSSKA